MAALESVGASNPMAKSYEYKLSKMMELLEGSMLPIAFGPSADGTTIQITNLPVIESYIAQQADEELQQTLAAILKDIRTEIEILNGPPSSYDCILYLNLHGVFQRDYYCDDELECLDDGIQLTKSGRQQKGKYSINELDSDNKNVTLLTSTCIGITHILNPEELSGQVKKLVDDQYRETRMLDVKKLQSSLRGLKQELIRTFDPEPSILKGKYTRESWIKFTHDIGWGISKNKWLNKTLQKDMEKFKWPIQILRDEKGQIPMDLFDKLIVKEGRTHMDLRGKYAPYITLDGLINRLLLGMGYSNILIIDSSCGDEKLYKGRYQRRLARWQKQAGLFDGGKKTKKNKKRTTKRKKTKRK